MNIIRKTVLPNTQNTNLNYLVRNYAFKSDLKIKWNRPEKIPCFKPEKSGDLSPMHKIQEDTTRLLFRDSKELETADENVKKLFSLKFAPLKETHRVYFYDIVQGVKRHEMDVASIEVKLAKWTGIIRAWQEIMERFPRNKKLKVKLKELIDKRKKHLKYLRRWDYKRFEWLIETLNIVYKPPPNHFHWITRKESLTKLTDKYCNEIQEGALNRYRLQLESEQPSFLEEKIRTLQFIRDEQLDCKVDVTVTQEEIDKVKKQLDDLLAKNQNRES